MSNENQIERDLLDLSAIAPEPLWLLGEGQFNAEGWIPARPEVEFALGWDIGQKVDPSALALVRRSRTPIPPPEGIGSDCRQLLGPNVFTVLGLERIALNTDYVAQCAIVANRLAYARARAGRAGCQLVCDITGGGLVISNVLTAHGLDHLGIVIRPGTKDDRSHGNVWHIAKQNIAARLSAEFHQKTLHILPTLREAAVLADEISNFHATVNEHTSYVSYGARSGKHDDLCLALGVALVYLSPNPAGGEWSSSSIEL